jgi:hypothetical protein
MIDMKKRRHGNPAQVQDDQNHHQRVCYAEERQRPMRAADAQNHAPDGSTREEAEDAAGKGARSSETG